MADRPLRPATRLSLGKPLPHQQADGTRTHLKAAGPKVPAFNRGTCVPWSYPVLARLSAGYPGLKGRLSTCYSPVRRFTCPPKGTFSHDLHVLGAPLAFALSQDQTLQLNSEVFFGFKKDLLGLTLLAI